MKPLRLSFRGACENPRTVRHYIPSGTFRRTSGSTTVRVEGGGYSLVWSPNYVGEGLLRILGYTKAHVRKRFREGLVSKVDHKPRYESIGALGKAARAVELDLSSAYLTAAVNIGALSDGMGMKLTQVSKDSRLMALGCLASSATVHEFENWVKVSTSTKYDAETGEVWRRIVAETDRIMQELVKEAGNEFLYYWCDAVFVKPSAAEKIRKKAELLGYRMRQKVVIMGVFGKIRPHVGVNDGRKFSLRRIAK